MARDTQFYTQHTSGVAYKCRSSSGVLTHGKKKDSLNTNSLYKLVRSQ